MPLPTLKNFAVSGVAAAPSPATSGTSLTVTTGHGTRFPDPATVGSYPVTIWPTGVSPTPANAEVATVTARSGDVLTIVRAQESTSARTVVVGDQIAATLTAALLTSGVTDGPPRLTFPTRDERVIQTFQSGHGWTLSGSSGTTFADDTSDYLYGTQSLRLTTGGAGASHEIRSPTLTAMDMSDHHLTLAIKIDSFTHYSDFQIRVSSNGFTDYAYCKPAYTSMTQRWLEPGRWQVTTISRAKLCAGISWGSGGWQYYGTEGNVDWSAITGVRFRCVDDAAGQMTIRLNLVGYFPRPTNPILSIMFDDIRTTQWEQARPYLDRYRMPATTAVIVESMLAAEGGSTTAYMTGTQLADLQANHQWAIAAHAYSNTVAPAVHTNGYDAVTYAAGEADMMRLRQEMYTRGFVGASLLVLPHGSWSISDTNPNVLPLARKYFDMCRTTHANTVETYPPADPWRIRSYTVANDDTAAELLAVVDQAIAAKAWACLQFHEIVDPATASSEVTPAVFQAFIDGVQSRVLSNGLLVRTPQQVLQHGAI